MTYIGQKEKEIFHKKNQQSYSAATKPEYNLCKPEWDTSSFCFAWFAWLCHTCRFSLSACREHHLVLRHGRLETLCVAAAFYVTSSSAPGTLSCSPTPPVVEKSRVLYSYKKNFRKFSVPFCSNYRTIGWRKHSWRALFLIWFAPLDPLGMGIYFFNKSRTAQRVQAVDGSLFYFYQKLNNEP